MANKLLHSLKNHLPCFIFIGTSWKQVTTSSLKHEYTFLSMFASYGRVMLEPCIMSFILTFHLYCIVDGEGW